MKSAIHATVFLLHVFLSGKTRSELTEQNQSSRDEACVALWQEVTGSSVTLGKLFVGSEPRSTHLQNGDKNSNSKGCYGSEIIVTKQGCMQWVT